MSIERIKEEAAKADQLIAELAKGADVSAREGETSEVDVEAAQPEVEQQQTDQGVVADAATEDQTPDAVALVREEAAKWEQRYRSLDGMIQARDRQIEQLHNLIASMQQAPKQDAEPEKPKGKQKLVTEQDEEAFGADLVDMARRAAREEQSNYIEQLEAKIGQLTQQLQGVAQTTAVTVQDRFESQLTSAVPNWRTVDADPAFISWLQSSQTRYKLFAEAARSHAVEDVAYFYQEFAAKQPSPQQKSVDPRLEKQVAPGKSKSTPTPAASQAEKKQWTRSEIAQVYADKKRYSPEEFTRIERDIASAQREGRVDFMR